MELLKVENLSVEIGGQKDKVKPVRDVSFSLHKGEVLAIVGESGCGKSMLCKSVIGLLPKSGKITAGSIYAAGTDITHYTERQMEKLRGSFFSMIFQDPLTALDPYLCQSFFKSDQCGKGRPKKPENPFKPDDCRQQ